MVPAAARHFNCVASVLAGTGIALGVLPLGTFNHFAKDLGIPLDRQEALRTILEGEAIQVDVGEVNGRVFLNNSSLGLYPMILRQRVSERRRLGRGKWAALFWATLTALRRSPFLNVRIRLDGKGGETRTPFVFIGNNEYLMEGLNIGRRERLDAGHLSIYVTKRRGRWGLLSLGVRALLGHLYQASDFEALNAQRIVVETRHGKRSVATMRINTCRRRSDTVRRAPGGSAGGGTGDLSPSAMRTSSISHLQWRARRVPSRCPVVKRLEPASCCFG